MAAKMAGLEQAPVIIKEPTERDKLAVSLIENAQRLDLTPIEKAEAYKKLQTEFNFSLSEIARIVGKSVEAVSNTLRLLTLSPEIKAALQDQKITEGHARAILMLKNPDQQKELLAKILKEKMSVRDVEDWCQKIKVWKPSPKLAAQITPHLHEQVKKLEERLKEILKLGHVKVILGAGRAKLTLFFNSKKELENFIDQLAQIKF
jgi:ParB family chromosome partitioning protein